MADSTPDPKIILKIARLKRIAADGAGDAPNAARMAAAMEAKYGVTVDVEDIDEFVEGEEQKARFEERWVHACKYEDRPSHDWRQFLIQQVAPMYGCVTYPKEVDATQVFFLWLSGEPEQLEYCSTHFEWLSYRIEVVASECDWDHLEPEALRGVRWGAMDRLLRNMTKFGPGSPQEAGVEYEDGGAAGALEGDVNPAALALTRGLVKVGGPGDPRADAPPPIDVDPPPMWAYQRGYRAAVLEEPKPPVVLLLPIERLAGLDGSTRSVLVSMGYLTVAQLVRARPKELAAQRGIGRKRLQRIREALAKEGLQLQADWGRGSKAPRKGAPAPERSSRRPSPRDRMRGRGGRRY